MSQPPWGQPEGTNTAPISLFDPSKFQNNVSDFPQQNQSQLSPGKQNSSDTGGNVQNSWNSWNWNSNPQGANGTVNQNGEDQGAVNQAVQDSNQWYNNSYQWNQGEAQAGAQQYWQPQQQQWSGDGNQYNQWQGVNNSAPTTVPQVDQQDFTAEVQYGASANSQPADGFHGNQLPAVSEPGSNAAGYYQQSGQGEQQAEYSHQSGQGVEQTGYSHHTVPQGAEQQSGFGYQPGPDTHQTGYHQQAGGGGVNQSEYGQQHGQMVDQSGFVPQTGPGYDNQSDGHGEGGTMAVFFGGGGSETQNDGAFKQAEHVGHSGEGYQNSEPRSPDDSVHSGEPLSGGFHVSANVPDSEKHIQQIDHQLQAVSLQNSQDHQLSQQTSVQGTEPGLPSLMVPADDDNQTGNAGSQQVGATHSPRQAAGHSEGQGSHDQGQDVGDRDAGLGDWEIVQPLQRSAPASHHSREASLDENVHFFIGSTNSSARVSPSNPQTSQETAPAASASENLTLFPGSRPLPKTSEEDLETEALSQPPSAQALPPLLVGGAVGPPPPGAESSSAQNPFRKTPVKVERTTPGLSDPMLSSTHLDVTKPNYENSPVVLDQSISPIPGSPDKQAPQQNTPITAEDARKSNDVPQSPITHRKEGPFQPPQNTKREIEARAKPVRASHDIPGISGSSMKDLDTKQPAYKSDRSTRIGHEGDRDRGRKTPEWDSERNRGRRTPDWDRDSERNRGRRTPDWDSDRYRGRKTPDWDRDSDRRIRERGRRTPDWDSQRSSEQDRESTRRLSDRSRDDDEKESRLASRPPKPSSRGPVPSKRQSAFHQIQTNRSLHNVSPATTLWDTDLSVASNIILIQPATQPTEAGKPGTKTDTKVVAEPKTSAATAPSELTPVASLITSLSEQLQTDASAQADKSATSVVTSSRSDHSKQSDDLSVRSGYSDRSKETVRETRNYDRSGKDQHGQRNSSRERYGRGRDDSYEHRRGNSIEREKERERYRESYRDRDDYGDRSYREKDRGRYTDGRPSSRTGSTSTDSRYRRDPYRDQQYGYRDERYDRPRSRHDENRPSSRQGEGQQSNPERPRSRTDYDRDPNYRDRYGRAYDYEDYYRRNAQGQQYYDRSYYDYYYGQGYYDEMGYYHADQYGNRYPYPTRQDQYEQVGSRPRSRVNTPGSLSEGGEEIFNYPPEVQDYLAREGYSNDAYYNYYNGYQSGHHGYDERDMSAWVQEAEPEPSRQTPEKFLMPHMRACFGPGDQLIKVLPNRPTDGQPASIEIHEVSAMLEDLPEALELKQFPGPLIKGDTHKNDVLLFCQKKARSCQENMELEDRDSAELIWRLLELLIKQNGTVVGTDIADLLLEGHEPTTMDYRRTGMKIASSIDNLDGDPDDGDVAGNVTMDRTSISRATPLEEATDRFRHLLLYGRKKDALDWAMKNNLWGHALFLASKMDSRAHANVMTRFANVAMRMNDPLQTLYQLMSGRQPAAVTCASLDEAKLADGKGQAQITICVTEERWGDWRPHLGMILSNHTSRPDLDRKCITTLGDTLAGKGYLHASHFCYLMSQTSFGSYNKKSSKIVLIGASHSQPLEMFASNEAIQCTEIYEYALALGNTTISLSNFQYFKYLYATRLAQYGLAQEALQYCEMISRAIRLSPVSYQPILVKLLFDLASQLKFSDPQRHEGGEEQEDPEWLLTLQRICQGFEDGSILPASGQVTPMYFGGTTASSESGEVATYMHENGGVGGMGQFAPDQVYGGQEQMYGSQDAMFGSQDQQYAATMYGAHQQSQYQEGSQPGVQEQYQQGHSYQNYQYGENQWAGHNQAANQIPASSDTTNQVPHHHQLHDGTAQAITDHASSVPSTNQNQDPALHGNMTTYDQSHTSAWAPAAPTSTGTAPADVKRASLASTASEDISEETEDVEGEDQMDAGQNPNIFDICQAPRHQGIVAPRLRKRTTSGSSAGSTTSSATAIHKPAAKPNKSPPALGGSKEKQAAGGGLFGGIFSMFKSKGKNEMKLPDDKKPSIVWDSKENRWVNLDGGEEDEGPAAPPPKDTDLKGPAPPHTAASAPSFAQPSVPSGPAPIMGEARGLAGNKYARPRGRDTIRVSNSLDPEETPIKSASLLDPNCARSQYVDVMNPKPVGGSGNVPTALFNTMPTSASAPAIFVPGGPADDSVLSRTAADQPTEPIPEERPAPPVNPAPAANPAPTAGLLPPQTMEDSLSRTSSMSSLSQEVQQFMSQGKEGNSGSLGGPVMFNPAQLQGGGFKQPPQGGSRLQGHRRVYPK